MLNLSYLILRIKNVPFCIKKVLFKIKNVPFKLKKPLKYWLSQALKVYIKYYKVFLNYIKYKGRSAPLYSYKKIYNLFLPIYYINRIRQPKKLTLCMNTIDRHSRKIEKVFTNVYTTRLNKTNILKAF